MPDQIARAYRNDRHAALPDLLAIDRKISIWNRLRSDCGGDRELARMRQEPRI
jgi:hypothetical protein